MLKFMKLQRVGYDRATEKQQQILQGTVYSYIEVLFPHKLLITPIWNRYSKLSKLKLYSAEKKQNKTIKSLAFWKPRQNDIDDI